MRREGTQWRSETRVRQAIGAVVVGTALASTIASVPLARAMTATEHRATSGSEVIAVALRGDIYAVPASGGSPHRLTHWGYNSAPALSPHGRLIAYLSTSKQYLDKYGHATTHSVWVVPVNGRASGADAWKLTATNPNVDRAGLSWSPDGQRLAYYEGATVVVSGVTGVHRTTVAHLAQPVHAQFGAAAAGPIAWSPNARRLAVVAPYTGQGIPRDLHAIVVDVARGSATTIVIHFPITARGTVSGAPGSFPTGQDLAWSADGRYLPVETETAGEGSGLTGLWRVSVAGGMATQVVGPSVLSPKRVEPATHVALAPDGMRILADPGDRLWVATASGAQGRDVTPVQPRGCVVAQERWAIDGASIAYVTVCSTGRSTTSAAVQSIVRATLYTVSASQGRPRALLHVDATDQNVLQLTPVSYRCVECGA